MKATFRFLNVLGIEFGVHYSWFIIFVLFSYLLAEGQLPGLYDDWTVAQYWTVAIASVLLLFLSVILHELGHALVARWCGISVRHITLFFFGGIAELEQESENARDEFLIAMAGPVVSLILSAMFLGLWFGAGDLNPQFAALTGYLALVNLLLAAFNMLPGFPLDGGRVLRAFVWFVTGNEHRATAIATAVGTGFGWLILGIGALLAVTGFLFNGLWLIAVGWFLQQASRQTAQANRQDEVFSGLTVRDLMNPAPVTVPPDVSLQRFVNHYVLEQNVRGVVVVEDGNIAGIVTLTDVRMVDQSRWPLMTVRQVMTPLSSLQVTQPDAQVNEALDIMAGYDLHQLPVVEAGQLVGLLTRSELVNYLQRVQELGMKV